MRSVENPRIAHRSAARRFAFRTATVICLIATALGITKGVAGQESVGDHVTRARQATVFIIQTYEQSGVRTLSCVGSGTLISPSGLIVTNAHLVEPTGPCRGEQIVVAMPVEVDKPPVPIYLADVIQVNETLDLAVAQIATGLDGSIVDTSTLNLPYVTPGDPSALVAGAMLNFVGYPDTGSSGVVAISGPISGTVSEKSGSRSAWLRTEASLGGVMSGGGAYDPNGNLVGVLTSAAGTDGVTPSAACLSIQDNTRDGRINEHDACVPVGNPVSMVRPISLALPLIEAAKNGLKLDHAPGLPESPLIAPPVIERMFFSTQVSDLGVPTKIVSSLPSGSTSLYLFFDYRNMRPGVPYELRATYGGGALSALSVGPLAWGGDRQGNWHIGFENFPLLDGAYDFTLLLSGQPVAVAKITVGGPGSEAAFSNLTFLPSSGQGPNGLAGNLFPAETVQVIAQFNYENMTDGTEWTEAWYLDGVEIFRTTRIWDKGRSGALSVSATNLAGLPLGHYRLELLIGQRLAATGDFTLAGARSPQGLSAAFSNARIATERTRDGQPAGQTGSVIPLGVTSLYVFVDWDFMPIGTLWTYRWFLDGRLVASSTQPWDAGGVGQNYWLGLVADGPLPEGSYDVEALVQNTPMFSSKVSIGSGTRPISAQGASVEAVTITGTALDALTEEGIQGAFIAVLNVKLTSAQFTWNEADIYSQAITDQRGRFALSKPLPKANYYTVYVFADGYTTMVEDFFTILSAQASPADIVIRLNRP